MWTNSCERHTATFRLRSASRWTRCTSLARPYAPDTDASAEAVTVGRHRHGRVEHHRRDRGQPDAERREGAVEHVVDTGVERSLRRRRVGERDRAAGEVLRGRGDQDGGPGGDPAEQDARFASAATAARRPGRVGRLGRVRRRLRRARWRSWPPRCCRCCRTAQPAPGRPGKSAAVGRVAGLRQARRQAVQGLSWAVLTGTAALGLAGVALEVGAGAVTVTFCAPL